MSNGATISDERLILILDKIVERRGVSNQTHKTTSSTYT
uniref:WSSV090 n=1 Tax=White spot syndrome virus TaxID=342409 RepID=A0A3G5BI51_9VIRU|nr:WSSV090 [White spot syndrome virus]